MDHLGERRELLWQSQPCPKAQSPLGGATGTLSSEARGSLEGAAWAPELRG